MTLRVLLLFLVQCVVVSASWGGDGATRSLPLPERPSGAVTGSAFYEGILPLSLADREVAVYQQIALGNVPDFMRELVPVTSRATIGGVERTAVLHVTPDYVAVGSDDDFFRMPMSAHLAQWVADLTGSSLPTRKVVDLVYTQSAVKLAPSPFSPGTYDITSVEVFYLSHLRIEEQRAGSPPGALVGGTKKDIVITPQLNNRPPPPRVAIYGWHQLNGSPIQPLSLVHGATYMDYSHGTRLVLREVEVDGVVHHFENLLADPVLHPLVSDEGASSVDRYPAPDPPPMAPSFPLSDTFPSTGRELPFWRDRFQTHSVVPFQPAAPDGDGHVLLVRDTRGGIDTARMGTGFETDYFVEAQIYCDYRPELTANGFDRSGLFLRDDGNGLFTGASSGGAQGNCYGMAWDSGDGRLWCFRTLGGQIADLLPEPVFHPSSGWRRFRVEADGNRLRFLLDGELLLETTDDTFSRGQFGIGYQELFSDNGLIVGARAENFRAGRPEGGESTGGFWMLR